MSVIQFSLENLPQNAEVKRNGNVVQLILSRLVSEEVLLSGFNVLNENNFAVQGDYLDYNTLFRQFDDAFTFELSNDGSVYVEPPKVEEPEAPEPTPEELLAIFEQNKNNKITESKLLLSYYLESNPHMSTCHGNKVGFYSITGDKQTLMMSQYMTYQIEKTVNPDAKLTWNETGKSCEEWTEEEFLQLILEIKNVVYPLVSKQQMYEEMIMGCQTQEELDGVEIVYGGLIE